MAAIVRNTPRVVGRFVRRRWPWIVGGLAAVPAAIVVVSLAMTESLDDDAPVAGPPVVEVPTPDAPIPSARPEWPEGKLDGTDAKTRLLAIVEDAQRRIDAAEGYTATFRKTERMGGVLLPEQTIAMKVRHRPFSVYLKFLAPKLGKEVIYAEGRHGNKVIAHNGDWTRRLIPRLAVEPDSPTALAENRHPITDVGLSNLVGKLVRYRRLDLEDVTAATTLDRTTGPDGRPWLRAIHLHPIPDEVRPFGRVEVLFDPATLLPRSISSYEWSAASDAAPLLIERYAYDDLALGAPLADVDFDPSNPAYAFLRY